MDLRREICEVTAIGQIRNSRKSRTDGLCPVRKCRVTPISDGPQRRDTNMYMRSYWKTRLLLCKKRHGQMDKVNWSNQANGCLCEMDLKERSLEFMVTFQVKESWANKPGSVR